jgi:uncharacterized protein
MLKSFFLCCLGFCLAANVLAQDISGNWYGVFRNPQGDPQRLHMVFEKSGNTWRGIMESPDITKESIAMDTVVAKGDTLRFSIYKIKLNYRGVWNIGRNRYTGYFEQMGSSVPLNISRKETPKDSIPNDLQDPGDVKVYDEQEVQFVNKTDKVLLSGTLTRLGAKKMPAIVLVSGIGANTRDAENLGHRPFAVLADYLTKHGMAVLRYDDRGTGSSTGNHDSSDIYNYAKDAEAAVQYLRSRKDIDTSYIGILGYQEGGALAQIVAANDPRIAYLIQMAGPGQKALDNQSLFMGKYVNIGAATPAFADVYKQFLQTLVSENDTVIRRQKAYESLRQMFLTNEDTSTIGEQVKSMYDAFSTMGRLSFYKYDPSFYLAKIKCPVLAVSGDADIEYDATVNLTAISRILSDHGNNRVTVRTFKGLNHNFQHCTTCTPDEYGTLPETINPAVLEFIIRWVQLLY